LSYVRSSQVLGISLYREVAVRHSVVICSHPCAQFTTHSTSFYRTTFWTSRCVSHRFLCRAQPSHTCVATRHTTAFNSWFCDVFTFPKTSQ